MYSAQNRIRWCLPCLQTKCVASSFTSPTPRKYIYTTFLPIKLNGSQPISSRTLYSLFLSLLSCARYTDRYRFVCHQMAKIYGEYTTIALFALSFLLVFWFSWKASSSHITVATIHSVDQMKTYIYVYP